MTPGQLKTYDTYWQMNDALEEAGVKVTGLVEEVIRYTSQEVGEIVDAFTVPADT